MNFMLAKLRSTAIQYMNDRCTIWRQAQIVNEYGQVLDAWQVVSVDNPCRVMPRNQQDANGVVAGVEAGTTMYQVALPHDADIEDGDRIEWNGRMHECMQVFAMFTQHVDRKVLMAEVGK